MSSIRISEEADEQRRLRLRVLIKVMLATAAAAVLFVILAFFFSGNDERPRLPTLVVPLAGIAPGESTRVLWERRPVIILRRTPEMITALTTRDAGAQLRDAQSRRSEQPVALQTALRSLEPEWFVAIALGTDQGCPVSAYTAATSADATTPANPIATSNTAAAGFADECRGSLYDGAGRVLADQYADRNLAVPLYDIETVNGQLQLVLGRQAQ